MFIDNAVIKKVEGAESYDKFAIAAALFGVSFQGASCSLLEFKVLSSCEGCNLRYLCRRLEEVIEDYRDMTTKVTESFEFS